MKRSLLFIGTMLCTGSMVVAAPEKQKSEATSKAEQKQPQATSAKTGKAKLQTRTGSKIQRTVDLSGRITDGPCQLIVITEESIRRSGASSVGQVLNRYGVRF